MITKSINEFGEKLAELVEGYAQDNEKVVITQNGKNIAVLLNFREYEKLVELIQFQKAILQGKTDILEGRTISHSELEKEAEKWLANEKG